MKFRKLGHATLALVGSIGLTFGLTSCSLDHTVGYVYVLGTQYNMINAFREDNNDGELKNVSGSPLGSGGNNPIRAVVPTGNRYMYVLNAGSATTDTSGNTTYASANISLFSIGGFGNLAQQIQYPSQGSGSIRLAVDSGGTHLLVLDQYAPVNGTTTVTGVKGIPGPNNTYTPSDATNYPCQDPNDPSTFHPVGDITVFNIDPATGRLTLVVNARQQNLTYFPVGCNPVDFRLTASFLYTMDAGSSFNNDVETINELAYTSTTGQLTPTQTGAQPVPPVTPGSTVHIANLGADNTSKYIYALDNSTNDLIYIFTIGTNGALTSVTGSPYSNSANTQAGGPVQTMSDSTGKFLYVANAGPAGGTSNANADVGGYVINQSVGNFEGPVGTSPFTMPTISNPVCIFEDATNQYVYTAGSVDNSITGRRIDPNTGTLSPLRSTYTFPTVGTPSWCLGISSAL